MITSNGNFKNVIINININKKKTIDAQIANAVLQCFSKTSTKIPLKTGATLKQTVLIK